MEAIKIVEALTGLDRPLTITLLSIAAVVVVRSQEQIFPCRLSQAAPLVANSYVQASIGLPISVWPESLVMTPYLEDKLTDTKKEPSLIWGRLIKLCDHWPPHLLVNGGKEHGFQPKIRLSISTFIDFSSPWKLNKKFSELVHQKYSLEIIDEKLVKIKKNLAKLTFFNSNCKILNSSLDATRFFAQLQYLR